MGENTKIDFFPLSTSSSFVAFRKPMLQLTEHQCFQASSMGISVPSLTLTMATVSTTLNRLPHTTGLFVAKSSGYLLASVLSHLSTIFDRGNYFLLVTLCSLGFRALCARVFLLSL